MLTFIPDILLYLTLIFPEFKGICDTRGFWLLLIIGTLVFKITSEASYKGKANSFSLQGTVNAFIFRMACCLAPGRTFDEEAVRFLLILLAMISTVLIHRYFSRQFSEKLRQVSEHLYANAKENEIHRRKKELLGDLIMLTDYENFVTYSTHLDKLMTNRPQSNMSMKDKITEWVRKKYFTKVGGADEFKSFRAYKYNKRSSLARILNSMYFIDKNDNNPIVFHEDQFNLPESKWEAMRLAAFRWAMDRLTLLPGARYWRKFSEADPVAEGNGNKRRDPFRSLSMILRHLIQ